MHPKADFHSPISPITPSSAIHLFRVLYSHKFAAKARAPPTNPTTPNAPVWYALPTPPVLKLVLVTVAPAAFVVVTTLPVVAVPVT